MVRSGTPTRRYRITVPATRSPRTFGPAGSRALPSADQLLELLAGGLLGLLAEDDHGQHVICRDVVLPHGVDQAPVIHDADAVRQVEDVVDVVADKKDADAVVLELPDQVVHLGRLRGS